MSESDERKHALKNLEKLEESRLIDRREFLSLSTLVATTAVFSNFLTMESAFAWVATRMRKGRGSSSNIDVGDIGHSLRFRSSATAYLSRTPAGAGNRKVWTWSCWFKSVKYNTTIFSAGDGSNQSYTTVGLGDVLTIGHAVSGSTYVNMVSSQVFRDPSAWYHLVISFNNGVIQAFINGQALTWSTNSNTLGGGDTWINSASLHTIGKITYASNVIDGYLSRIAIIDGQALTPTSFGYLNSNCNSWVTKSQFQVKAVVDAGGVNSFMLDFDDGSSVANLGLDKSTKANNWTCNNISLTAGVTFDWMTDTPSNNYCTLNPISTHSSSSLSNASLTHTCTLGPSRSEASIHLPTSGKYYAEFINSSATNSNIGIGFGVSEESVALNGNSVALKSYHFYASNAPYVVNNGTSTAISSWTNLSNQVFQLAVDIGSGKVWVGQNNTWWDSSGGNTGNPNLGTNPTFSINPAGFKVFTSIDSTSTINWAANFGQRPFAFTPPTGFKTLCTFNLPTPTITDSKKYFDINLYSGDSAASRIITNSGMMPNLVWTKARNAVDGNNLVDTVRGVNRNLKTDTNTAETTGSTVTSFNSNGFTVDLNINVNGRNYVAWQWKQGVVPGFDIVTYTGDGNNSRQIPHSLGVTPSFYVTKNRNGYNNTNGFNDWNVFHKSTGTQATYLMSNIGAGGAGGFTGGLPTSTYFYPNQQLYDNVTGQTYVAYVFSEVNGFSKFGSYVGNGSSDGPFIYCGFRPKYVMVKWVSGSISSVSNAYWVIWDSSRNPRNISPTNSLFAHSSTTEDTSYYEFDFLSNGFKIRLANGDRSNYTGGNYIYIAFAEAPFKYSNAR